MRDSFLYPADGRSRVKLARKSSIVLSEAMSSTGIVYKAPVKKFRTEEDVQELKQEYAIDDHLLSIKDLENRYDTNLTKGLTKEQAAELLIKNGPNSLIPPATKSRWIILLEYLFCGFATLLWGGAVLTILGYVLARMKDANAPNDSLYLGIVLISVILLTGIFGFYQESENAAIMDSFNKMIPKVATVVRDGVRQTIPCEEIVVGDLVDVTMGECVPADIRIIKANTLMVDNSSITGESLPQSRGNVSTDNNPLETANLAFYSTFVVEGSGTGVVISCGDNTLIGRLAGLTSSLEKQDTPLRKEIRTFVIFITVVAVAIGLIFFTVSMIIGYDFFTSLTYLIAIVVANVPEGLPVTMTACMTLTAKRMASKNCLVKNIQAIEALGSCNVICSDKTGTLTQNRMTIAHVYYEGNNIEVLESFNGVDKKNVAFKALCNVATLCSRSVYAENQEDIPIISRKVAGDASESAILKFMDMCVGNTIKTREGFPKVCEIPFKSSNKFQLSIHKLKDGKNYYILVMKGAPEGILSRCSFTIQNGDTVPLSPVLKNKVKKAIVDLGNLGERVLGFADYYLPANNFGPGYAFNAESPNFPITGLRFCGLMSMVDPARPSVPEAVAKCKSAGIRVIMVTGDHPITAAAIARKVGILSQDAKTAYDIALRREVSISMVSSSEKSECNAAVITGNDLREMEESELLDYLVRFKEIVFARTSPQQKLKIVEGFQKLNNIVAVTGDGVNDSPALKKADIGIAMGIAGSDVTKETADMILLDDNFATIVTGIEEGRLIFDNLKKSIAYLLTSNVPEVVPFIFLVTLNIPQALSVMAIMVIDVGTDLWPAISLAYEKPEADIMSRNPRDMKRDKLINFRMIYLTYFQIGLIQTAASFTSFFFIMAQHGFFFDALYGIRVFWESPRNNDVTDSYHNEWTYEERNLLQFKGHSAYFLSIVMTQIADLLICKTRRLSLFQQGMNNWVLNTGIVFELCLASFIVFCPGVNRVLQFAPINLISVVTAIPFAFMIFGYDELRKLMIRRFPHGDMPPAKGTSEVEK